jgi:hypothetical protein
LAQAGAEWTVEVNLRQEGGEVERSRAFSKRAIEYIFADPTDFIRRAAIKFIRYWNIIPNTEQYRSPVYRWISLASFGPVLFFALICAFNPMPRRRSPQHAEFRLATIALIPSSMIAYFDIIHR